MVAPVVIQVLNRVLHTSNILPIQMPHTAALATKQQLVMVAGVVLQFLASHIIRRPVATDIAVTIRQAVHLVGQQLAVQAIQHLQVVIGHHKDIAILVKFVENKVRRHLTGIVKYLQSAHQQAKVARSTRIPVV